MSTSRDAIITRLRVRNYRSLAEVDIHLAPLTVLVGQNGTGKSNVVDVLRFVRDSLTRGLDAAVLDRHGMSAIRRWSGKGRPFDVHIQLSLRGQNWSGEYGFTLGSERRGEYRVKRERCALTVERTEEGEGPVTSVLETRNGKWVQLPMGAQERLPPERQLVSTTALMLPTVGWVLRRGAIQLYSFLSRMGFYTLYPDNLRPPQKAANPDWLSDGGDNLASVLRQLKKSKSSGLSSMLEALGKVVPGVHDYQVAQVGGYLVTRLRHAPGRAKKRGPAFELAQESDGTLRMLAILTALYQDPSRSLLTIEEPELTIHPGALGVLRDVLQEASLRSQIVITTHSPDLVAGLPADVLRAVEKVNGVTRVGPITDAQREAIDEMLFSPGELMRMEGLRRETADPLPE